MTGMASPPLSRPCSPLPTPSIYPRLVQNNNAVRAMQEKVWQAIHQGLSDAATGKDSMTSLDSQEAQPYSIVTKPDAMLNLNLKNLARQAHAGAAGEGFDRQDRDTEISVDSPRTSVDSNHTLVLKHSGSPLGTQVSVRAPKHGNATGDAHKDDDSDALPPSSAQLLLTEVESSKTPHHADCQCCAAFCVTCHA